MALQLLHVLTCIDTIGTLDDLDSMAVGVAAMVQELARIYRSEAALVASILPPNSSGGQSIGGETVVVHVVQIGHV